MHAPRGEFFFAAISSPLGQHNSFPKYLHR